MFTQSGASGVEVAYLSYDFSNSGNDDDSSHLWEQVKKDIKKLSSNKRPRVHAVKAPKKASRKTSLEQKSTYTTPPETKASPIEGIDGLRRSVSRQLRSGVVKIDATLDLHGLREDAAFQTLLKFVEKGYAMHYRVVLVITGKGSVSSPSLLRNSFPIWIAHERIAPYVIRFCHAAPKHGGDGAFYVYVRRKKELHRATI